MLDMNIFLLKILKINMYNVHANFCNALTVQCYVLNLPSHLLQSLRAYLRFAIQQSTFSKPRILHESPIDDLVILTPLSTRIYYLKFDGVKHCGPSIEVIMLTAGTRFLHWN